MRIRFGTSNRVVSRLFQAIGPQGEVRRRGDVAERDKDVSPGHRPAKRAPGRLASSRRRGIETLLRLERSYEVRRATGLTEASGSLRAWPGDLALVDALIIPPEGRVALGMPTLVLAGVEAESEAGVLVLIFAALVLYLVWTAIV